MRRLHINSFFGFCLDPSVKNAAARKNESVGPVVTDDGQFEIAVKWRFGYRLPLHIGSVEPGYSGALIWIRN